MPYFSRPRLTIAFVVFATLANVTQTTATAQESVDAVELPAPAAEEAGAKAETVPGEDVSGSLVIDKARTGLIQDALFAASVSGVVAKVHVEAGQKVEPDALLVKLKSELAETRVMAAEAALQAANLKHQNDINLRYAKRKLQLVELEAKRGALANDVFPGVVSDMDLDRADLKVDLAKLELEQVEADRKIAYAQLIQSEANLFSARSDAERQVVRTSVAGLVTEVRVAAGESVGAGEPLVRIVSLDPLRVDGFIEAHQYATDLVGREVTFIPTGAAGDTKLKGRVVFVSPELHPVTGQVLLRASVANPDGRVISGSLGKLIVD